MNDKAGLRRAALGRTEPGDRGENNTVGGRVDAVVSVYGKPYQTAVALASLFKYSGDHIDTVFVQEELVQPHGESIQAILACFPGRKFVHHKPAEFLSWVSPERGRLAEPGFRQSVRYQYAWEHSTAEHLFVFHNDCLFLEDMIGAMRPRMIEGGFAGAGLIGQCWNCPASFVGACSRDTVQDYAPSPADVEALLAAYPDVRTKSWMIDPQHPAPLPECRLNEFACLISLAECRPEVVPIGDVVPFGFMSLDIGTEWFHQLFVRGHKFLNWNGGFIHSPFSSNNSGHEADLSLTEYEFSEGNARTYLNEHFPDVAERMSRRASVGDGAVSGRQGDDLASVHTSVPDAAQPSSIEHAMSETELVTAVEEAIWSSDPARLQALPQAMPTSWAGAVQSDFIRFGLHARLGVPTVAAPACLQIAVVMMVKDEADIIQHNLEWLYFCGVRRFIMLDNGSTDATVGHMREFRTRHADVELLVLDDPRVGYAQSLKTTGMMRLAISVWPDLIWTFPIDADEFLIPSQGWGPVLALHGRYDAITIPKVVHFNAHPVADDRNGPPMAEMPLRNLPFMRAPNVACGSHVHRGVSDGNHHAVLLDGRSPIYAAGLAAGLYYREFQMRSAAHFRRKVLNGGPAILAAKAAGQFAGGDHWLAYYALWQAEGDAGLFARYTQECVKSTGPDMVIDPFLGVPR